ncbi:MAG: nuclear transport factor 2 family protein [Bacteroidetes bacterium]|nr:nuclear transport factor 2 family protein [Bacteroidota bacterium]
MRYFFITICLLLTVKGFSQKTSENEVLKISADIFKWEVENKIDSVANILHTKFIVVGSDGSISQKSAYIKRLSGEDFKHNAIEITENTATVSGNTATVIGKGKFDMTISGNKRIQQLSYIEVFTRENTKSPWKMLALKASVIN